MIQLTIAPMTKACKGAKYGYRYILYRYCKILQNTFPFPADYSRSKLLSSAPEEVLAALQTKSVTYNHHKQSLTPTVSLEHIH